MHRLATNGYNIQPIVFLGEYPSPFPCVSIYSRKGTSLEFLIYIRFLDSERVGAAPGRWEHPQEGRSSPRKVGEAPGRWEKPWEGGSSPRKVEEDPGGWEHS